MKLLYAFPEPLPLPRARAVQVENAVASLADAGVGITLAYVPVANVDPLGSVLRPPISGVQLLPLSRAWPAPLNCLPPFSRWHSVRLFGARLKTEIVVRQPDCLFVRHLKLADLLLAARLPMPLIYEAHEVFAETATARRRVRIADQERRVVAGATAVVCNTVATATRLTQLYGAPRHLLVLPNGVVLPESLTDKPWNECKRHVVYSGSFFGWKGVEDLVTAAGRLPDFRIALVGGDAEQIAHLNRKLSIGGAEVEFFPRLPHSQVMERLAASCIAVLPNRPDPDSAFTSPIKLFEYMATGCAIVAADLPVFREVLSPEDAIWFKAGDADSLSNALHQLGNNPQLARQVGERGRKNSKKFTWAARANRLKSFLEPICLAHDRGIIVP